MNTYNSTEFITLVIFSLTYIGLAFGSVPKIKIDRTSIAFIGATAMIAFTHFSLKEAGAAINFPLLCLLFGMMVIIAYLNISGFFKLTVNWLDRFCHKPKSLLALTIFLAGFLSAFLINDIVCLAMTPLLIHICNKRNLPAIPYLLAIATAANIGSIATLTGNPQNMLIATFSGLNYLYFTLHTAPLALIGLLLNYALIQYLYRHDLKSRTIQKTVQPESLKVAQPSLLIKSIIIAIAVIILFFTGLPLGIIALGGAALLLFDKTPPEKIYRLIEWPLLILFISLFILIGALEKDILSHWQINHWFVLQHYPKTFISLISIILSNLVSNVPTALLFKPVVIHAASPQNTGILLAAMTTLAGNLTMLGSIANIIVVTQAKQLGVNLRFVDFLRLGIPLTLATVLVAYFILSL